MKGKTKSFFSPKYTLRLLNTIRYLKWQQIFYRCYYPFKKSFFKEKFLSDSLYETAIARQSIDFQCFSNDCHLYDEQSNTFTFLNQSKKFEREINWEFNGLGDLWTFHLHYFNWLNDDGLTLDCRLQTMRHYIQNGNNSNFSYHSFTSSTRLINWIKFLLKNQINDRSLIAQVYKDAQRVEAFPEYELMGNHLLLNGIALVWAGVYFDHPSFLKFGGELLDEQLAEQILSDGAHFEKSPSYHTIFLKFLLETKMLCEQAIDTYTFSKLLNDKCSDMHSHVVTLIGRNENLPFFGDSNNNETLNFEEISNLARNLSLNIRELKLSDSGWRKFSGKNYELFFESGSYRSAYQPGHAHADTFTFCLFIAGRPFIVDSGVSTYQVSSNRLEERGTAAHNTITINDTNSSDIWAAFRMGKRAVAHIIEENSSFINCEHNGYSGNFGVVHRRSVECKEHEIVICDELKGWKGEKAEISFHFQPELPLIQDNNSFVYNDNQFVLEIEGAELIVEQYEYAVGFNSLKQAVLLKGSINKEVIITRIKIKDGETN